MKRVQWDREVSINRQAEASRHHDSFIHSVHLYWALYVSDTLPHLPKAWWTVQWPVPEYCSGYLSFSLPSTQILPDPHRSSSSSASTRRPAGLLSETVGSQTLSNSQYSKGTGIWHEWSFLVNLTDLSHLWAPRHPARVDSQYSPWSEGFQSRYGYSGSVMLKLPSSFTSQPEVSYFLPSTSITPCFIIHIIFLILILIKIISWIGS